MDLNTIQNIVNTRGYAFLTQAQKDAYNNQFGATKPTPSTILPSSTGIVSSEQGMNLVNQAKTTESKISPYFPTAGTTTTEKKEEKPATSTKINLINPSTGQSVSFEDASINRGNIEGYLSMGYELAEASGNVPSWLATSQTKKTSSPFETDLDSARSEVESLTNKLKSFDVSQDPQLQSILSGIESRFNSRIAEMERINKSRTAAISTTGIRLGSRYTGGAGGMFGGIISEEERQGISRIGELEAQKQAALTEARSAYESKKWDKYVQLVNLAQKKYDDTLKEVSEFNKKQIEQDAKIKERADQIAREQNLLDLLGGGVEDMETLQKKSNLTIKEITDSLKAITGEEDDSKLGTDLRDFNYLKSNNYLPSSITSLPPSEQYLAWQQAVKSANTADNYTPVIDPVTGDQSVFDKKRGVFVSGGGGIKGTGAGGKVTSNDLLLNAAKNIAIANPTGGKLLVREVSNKLKQGDEEGAMKFIKDNAVNSLPESQRNDYSTYENSMAASLQATDLINSSNIETGPYKELYESKKPYLLIDKDPKYAQLKQLISLADAQIRRGFFGTAVTAAEGGTAGAFLFDPNDNIEVIKQKLLGNIAFFSFVNDAMISRATGLPKPSLSEYLAKYGVSATGTNEASSLKNELENLELPDEDFWGKAK